MKKDKEKKASIPKICFLLAQTFSLKEKLYQKNYFLSTGSFFRKKVFCEKKKCWYRHGYVLPLLFVLPFILAFAATCPTASAGHYDEGCGFYNYYNGTLRGGVYFDVFGWYAAEGTTETGTFENVPAGRQIVRFYAGIWLGSETVGQDIHWSFTFDNGHTESFTSTQLGTPWCNDTAPPDDGTGESCTISCTGCGVCNVIYNASAYIVTGDNNITFWTDEQIYDLAFLTVYENESMPEIQYWIKEGHMYPNDSIPYYEYFNETADTGKIYLGSLKPADYWIRGYPHPLDEESNPELNGHNIGAPDFTHAVGGWPSWLSGYLDIPADYVTVPSNEFKYEEVALNGRQMAAVLVLNYYEPGNLTVADIAPESVCVNWSNAIFAEIVNYGDTARLFNVTLYANEEVVDVKRVENLGEGENRTLKFLWEPSATGFYVLNVTADVENVVRETDETNNSKTVDVEVKEAQPPAWSNPSSNVTEIPNGGYIELRAQGIADVGLDTAILATDETGTWENITDGRYGSPSDMASCYNYSVTHTTESDWNNQTMENLSVDDGDVVLGRILGPNVAKDQPVDRDSVYYDMSDYEAYRANNGDFSDFWLAHSGAPMPSWWYVDLGNVKDIGEINVTFLEFSVPIHYAIYTSNNATTWTKRIEKNFYIKQVDTISNLDWSCRYINVTIIKAFNSDYGNDYRGIYEFKAYDAGGDYKPNGMLASKTIVETDNPIGSVIPTWNLTKPAGTSFYVNVSVDNGATWKPATNGTELTWNYNISNRKLKYKVLFETTDVTKTPVLHDISLNYTTKDPIEGEWLWSNFTWHNASIPNGTTVAWKIYYEDMLGQTNCTYVETFYVGETGDAPNVVVTVHNVSFGNVLAGDNTTIYISLTLNNTEGTASADIEAVFKTNVSEIYGLNGTGAHIIPGNYFELGPDTNEKALTNTTAKTFISTLPAGENVTYNAILTVPAGQAADDYSGIVELSW